MPRTQPAAPHPAQVEQVARRALGVEELRDGQRPSIDAVLRGHDVLSVMPTGSGKSAIYQVAGALIDGPTLVVTPLVALQHDQVRSLERLDAGDAAALNSTASPARRARLLERVHDGSLEFLLLAPEQLARPETLDQLVAAAPSLVVVEEAHCVSAWGHDFRPDYLRLRDVFEALGHPPTIALTATASPPVRRHIVDRLGLRDVVTVVTGLDRPNIDLQVRRPEHERDKLSMVRDVLEQHGGRRIVYTMTRQRTEDVAALLADSGVEARAYHAGLSAGDRRAVHDGFVDGSVDVVVATSAFGMGIDVSDVRGVVHWDTPDSLDEYSQEIGRAGRDGDPAQAHLLFRPEDLSRRTALHARRLVAAATVERVLEALAQVGDTTDVATLAAQLDLHPRSVTAALTRLREVDAVELDARGGVRVRRLDGALRAVQDDDEARRTWQESRAALLREYAESARCRRQALLGYFGQAADPCGDGCDNCRRGIAGPAPSEATTGERPEWLRPDRPVVHVRWGEGRVVRSNADATVVWFEREGYRTLSTPLVLERDGEMQKGAPIS